MDSFLLLDGLGSLCSVLFFLCVFYLLLSGLSLLNSVGSMGSLSLWVVWVAWVHGFVDGSLARVVWIVTVHNILLWVARAEILA